MKRHNHRRALFIETLETRALLAGNVVATVDASGKLFLTGDGLDNRIEIRQIPQSASTGEWPGATYEISNPWVPQGETLTTINGQASVVVEGVKTGMQINMGDGNDHVLIYRRNARANAAGVPGTVSVSMGDGNDQANLYVVNHMQIYVNLGVGVRDVLVMAGQVTGLSVLGDPHPEPGGAPLPAGTDEVYINGVRIDGAVSVDTEYGDDLVSGWFTTSNSQAAVSILTGAGSDNVHFDTADKMSLKSTFRLDTGAGNDAVTMSGVHSDSRLAINTGPGSDGVTVGRMTLPRFVAWMGDGDDALQFGGNFTSDESMLGGGNGTDTLFIRKDSNNDLGNKTVSGFEIFLDS